MVYYSNMDYTPILKMLRERKKFLRMSEAFIAQEAGLSQSYVSRLLSGKCRKFYFDDLEKIARILGCFVIEPKIKELKSLNSMVLDRAVELAGHIRKEAEKEALRKKYFLPIEKRREMEAHAFYSFLYKPRQLLWRVERKKK